VTLEIDTDAVIVNFEVIGERPKYHITAKNYRTGEVVNTWLSKDQILSKLQEWTDKGFTIWVSFNEIEEGKDSIEGVSKICDLWFDIDSERKDKAKPATDEEIQEALDRALKLKNFIEREYKAQGFLAKSGNGVHLHFPLPCYPLIGERFRLEVNEKLRNFAIRAATNAGVKIDHTYDLRRVSTIIGTYNQKIPSVPLKTKWDKQFFNYPLEHVLENVRTARKVNKGLLEAILNEKSEVRKDEGAEFSGETFERLKSLRLADQKLDDLLDGVLKGYKSRSEAEEALAVKLVSNGFSRSQVFYIMQNISKIGKWKENNEKYWTRTYERAVEWVNAHKNEKYAESKPEDKIENPLNEDEDPLEAVLKPIKRVVLMEPAIETLVLAGLSAYTEKPLNVVILKQKTAQGGSYTLTNALSVFPPEDVLFLDYASPTSFFHERIIGYADRTSNEDVSQRISEMRQNIARLKGNEEAKEERVQLETGLNNLMRDAVGVIDLSHKIIAFTEPPNAELFSKLKALISADRDRFDISVTNRSSAGSLRTESVRIIGHPVFIMVLSEDEIKKSKLGVIIEPQLASRFLKVEINTDPKKFEAGKHLLGAQYMNESPINAEYEAELERARQYIRYLREQIVALKRKRGKQAIAFNPFVEELETLTPSETGEDTRSFAFLLALIENMTLIYFTKRLHLYRESDGDEFIITNYEDAFKTFERYKVQLVTHLPPSKLNEFELLKPLLKDSPLPRDEIFQSGLFPYTNSHGLYNHLLAPLVRNGYLTTIVDPADPRHQRVLYRLKSDAPVYHGVGGVGQTILSHETEKTTYPGTFGVGGVGQKNIIMKWIEDKYKIKTKKGPADITADLVTATVLEQQKNAFFGVGDETRDLPHLPRPTPGGLVQVGAGNALPAPKHFPMLPKLHPVEEYTTAKGSYVASASPLPEERALGNFVIISYSGGAKEYECPKCRQRFKALDEAKEHAISDHAIEQTVEALLPKEESISPASHETGGQSDALLKVQESIREKIRSGKTTCNDGESINYKLMSKKAPILQGGDELQKVH